VNLKDTNRKGKKLAEMVDNNTLNNSGNVNDMSYASGITNSEHSIDANTITGPTATLKTVLKCECDNGDHEYLRNTNELTRQCYKPY